MYNEEEQVKQEQPGIGQQVANEIVDTGKREMGKRIWKFIISHLEAMLPIIGSIFAIVCFIGLTFGVLSLIKNAFVTASAAENPDSVSSVQDANIVYLGENGEYKITVENIADQILENLETQKIDNEAAGFSTDNLDNMIDKYIKAEIQTTYPETGASGITAVPVKMSSSSSSL